MKRRIHITCIELHVKISLFQSCDRSCDKIGHVSRFIRTVDSINCSNSKENFSLLKIFVPHEGHTMYNGTEQTPYMICTHLSAQKLEFMSNFKFYQIYLESYLLSFILCVYIMRFALILLCALCKAQSFSDKLD